MIITKMNDGLACQMFQYALGRHLSLKNKTDLLLEVSWYNKNVNPVNPEFPRNFGLDKLKTRYKAIDGTDLWWRLRLGRKLSRFHPLPKFEVVKEKEVYKYDSDVINKGDNLILHGYWNNYKYSENIRNILLEEFTPKESADDQNQYFFKENPKP